MVCSVKLPPAGIAFLLLNFGQGVREELDGRSGTLICCWRSAIIAASWPSSGVITKDVAWRRGAWSADSCLLQCFCCWPVSTVGTSVSMLLHECLLCHGRKYHPPL
ncbi:hypothetical protein CEXT_409961 [Caerostris extrusa]|uniref:Secreted protein n=1 Tax=Caerostris extrusa TaxID=172846 RepID=A0AAV4XKB6_CAEEX|nr:hypothetical protein CEXT_409961 [Caerostris extrusa]